MKSVGSGEWTFDNAAFGLKTTKRYDNRSVDLSMRICEQFEQRTSPIDTRNQVEPIGRYVRLLIHKVAYGARWMIKPGPRGHPALC